MQYNYHNREVEVKASEIDVFGARKYGARFGYQCRSDVLTAHTHLVTDIVAMTSSI